MVYLAFCCTRFYGLLVSTLANENKDSRFSDLKIQATTHSHLQVSKEFSLQYTVDKGICFLR